jgi:hypothetical protein
MAPGDYEMYLGTNNCTQTNSNFSYYTDSYSVYNCSFEWPEEIVIKEKPKYKLERQTIKCSQPKMKKKQYSRLVCRRG